MSQRFARRSVSMPTPMLEDLKAEAAARDMSLSQLVREYVRYGRVRDNQGNLDLKRDQGDDSGN